MPFIDERVTKALTEYGGEMAVLIVCDTDCDSVANSLTSHSIAVDKGAADLGIIRAVVDAKSLEVVKATSGIASIEPDEEVTAQ